LLENVLLFKSKYILSAIWFIHYCNTSLGQLTTILVKHKIIPCYINQENSFYFSKIITGGSVDATGYYSKSQVDNLIAYLQNSINSLTDQIYALQKCSQSVYVPTSNSDLYDYSFRAKVQPNPHELLFRDETFTSFDPNPNKEIVGTNMFMNPTRVQVRELTRQDC
jgi:cytochrome c2